MKRKGMYSNHDSCPIHVNGKHSWGDCFFNPHGHNYKPNYAAAKSGSNSSDNSNGYHTGSEATTSKYPIKLMMGLSETT